MKVTNDNSIYSLMMPKAQLLQSTGEQATMPRLAHQRSTATAAGSM
jgi:hypothetical protein